jgi:hypothetical protein
MRIRAIRAITLIEESQNSSSPKTLTPRRLMARTAKNKLVFQRVCILKNTHSKE